MHCCSLTCSCSAQVGYLLGLGDRHPSNLMLDRYSGKLLHIDFGDCFEASMHREKFPEKARPPLSAAACTLAATSSLTVPWLSPCSMAEQCSRLGLPVYLLCGACSLTSQCFSRGLNAC